MMHTVDTFLDIPKMQNEIARMQFLLKRLKKDIEELANLGVTIDVNVSSNNDIPILKGRIKECPSVVGDVGPDIIIKRNYERL